jgi:hypothetical protein
MRRPYIFASVTAVVMLAAAPVQAASAAVVTALVAAGVVGTAAVLSMTPGRDAWAYTDQHGWVGGARDDLSTINTPLAARSGASQRLVNACRDAIAENAERYDLASLEAVAAGEPTRVNGRTVVPLDVRAIYRVRGVHEVRRSTVRCELDRAGRVIGTS